jgi:16S rRNA (guanine527-N7)-methyltransferase
MLGATRNLRKRPPEMTAIIENETQAREFVRERTSEDGFARIERFVGLLLDENQRQNLISRPSESEIWKRHIADSIQLLNFVPRETLSGSADPWLDLGTGAGPPGLVIAAAYPQMPMKLVESRAKRVEFLRSCISALDLSYCEVIGSRLEQVAPFNASVISARAFAPLDKLLRLSAPFSTSATRYVLPKGRSAAHELEQQKSAIRKMFHVEHSLTDSEAGIIVKS